MEQFKAEEKDWQRVEEEAIIHPIPSTICELRDRVEKLEAEREATCKPALQVAAVPSDKELIQMWDEALGGVTHGLRVVWNHGYARGLAAGRAEQQATTEPPTDPAMTALELPRDWYPDFADWLKRQMPEGTVIGDPWWWASCIADWLIAKATREAGPLPQAGAEISDEEIDQLEASMWEPTGVHEQGQLEQIFNYRAFARAVLARWGGAAVPVPVSERLPGPEDCDAEDRCWLCGKVEGDWRLMSAVNPGVPHLKYCFSHWLPHWALPVPAAAAGEVQP
jgi:hypothetical protein